MKKAIDDELRSATFRSQDLVSMERIVAQEKRKLRDDTIEECARVADSYAISVLGGYETSIRISAAIRALKDKP